VRVVKAVPEGTVFFMPHPQSAPKVRRFGNEVNELLKRKNCFLKKLSFFEKKIKSEFIFGKKINGEMSFSNFTSKKYRNSTIF
jgi:hypothetical protein